MDKGAPESGTTAVGIAREVYIPAFKVTQELLDKLIFAGLTPKVKVNQTLPGFEVCVGFQRTVGPKKLVSTSEKVKVGQSISGHGLEVVCFQSADGPGPYEGSIELIGSAEFLSSLTGGKSCAMDEAKVKLEVTKIVGQATYKEKMRGFADNSMGGNGQHFELTPTGESLLFNSGQDKAKRFEVSSTADDNWSDHWSSNSFTWTILVAVKLVLYRIIGADPAVQDLLAVNRRMLTDGFLADTKVIAQNGAETKFHRSILAAHSSTFEQMFRTKMQEAATGVLELPDMTEESVKALKEYLYVWELKAPQENSLVCFELFEAGHKYRISTLEKATSKILLRMGGAWYSALVGLRLFLLVKDMELPDLKQRAVQVLKLKRVELKTLDEYRDLFRRENAAVAMELTECLASP